MSELQMLRREVPCQQWEGEQARHERLWLTSSGRRQPKSLSSSRGWEGKEMMGMPTVTGKNWGFFMALGGEATGQVQQGWKL